MIPFFLLALAISGVEWRAEHARPDPFGGTVAADKGVTVAPGEVRVSRRAYASAHLVVKGSGIHRITIDTTLPVDIYREWFHAIGGVYYPDALIPTRLPIQATLPQQDNRVPGQTAQAYWVDIWVPADAKPGPYNITAKVESGGQSSEAALKLVVRDLVVPEGDTLSIDHNSYGTSWFADQYPQLAKNYGDKWTQSAAFFKLIHSYHRIFYEHRGVYHQLGYGHGGKVAPEFAPELAGIGRTKRIASWDLFDKHYGPLLDGSAFQGTRRGPKAIPFAYLPVNPEWPASFVSWGEPGYDVEFVNVVKEMEKHFREKGWTQTRFELFFNHKKRYKAFPWDGDEVRFMEDDRYFKQYWRLWREAWPASSPVKSVFRTDASWSLEKQFKDLEGVVNMWVSGSDCLSWLPEASAAARKRGDIVWHYSGPPKIQEKSIAITRHLMRAWVWNVDGFVHWLAVSPGSDPWFANQGADTALVYSGERFGFEEPIPTVRLKIQRNALQDLAVLNRDRQLAAVTKAFNETKPAEWWNDRPAGADNPPSSITNPDIDDWARPAHEKLMRADAAAWQRVRELLQ